MADYSPIVSVGYDTVGNNFAGITDLGEIRDDSSHEPSLYEDERNTRNEVMYSGRTDSYTIQCFDTGKHAALMTAFKNDERRDYRLTKEDGTQVDVLDAKVRVGDIVNPMQAGQRASFPLYIEKFVS